MPNNELARVHERLDEIAGNVSEIAGDIKAINTTCSACRKQVAQHDKILDGNTGDGLRTRMTVAENLLGELRESKTKWYWMFVGAAASLLVSIVGGVSVVVASGLLGR